MKVKIVNKSGFDLPKYETEGAAAFDIRAIINQGVTDIMPGEQMNIDTGLYFEIPKGYELQIRGRSGNAFRHGIGIVHGVGTIDSDYRGEVKVCLINHGEEVFYINHSDRIAQGVIAPIIQAEWEEVEELDTTERGTGGFGSTGRNRQ